jgi:hypothetical protein
MRDYLEGFPERITWKEYLITCELSPHYCTLTLNLTATAMPQYQKTPKPTPRLANKGAARSQDSGGDKLFRGVSPKLATLTIKCARGATQCTARLAPARPKCNPISRAISPFNAYVFLR